jgi:hypothetical protein
LTTSVLGRSRTTEAIEEELVSNSTFDTISRHAATAVSRRGSLCALAAAALAGTFAAPATTSAGKAGKKRKTRCGPLGERCRRAVAEGCNSQGCLDAVLPCCEHFARCRVSAGGVCISVNE